MRISTSSLLPVLGLAALALTGCSKDADYDALTESDGIDLTMRVGKGLSLPFGSTDKVYLTELLDTAKVRQLTSDADGNFYLSQIGTFQPASYQINPFQIDYDLPLCNDILTLVSNDLPQGVQAVLTQLQQSGVDLAQYVGSNLAQISPLLQGQSYSINATSGGIRFDKGTECNISVSGVDQGLVDASRIGLSQRVALNITFSLSNLPGRSSAYTIDLKELTISLPDYLQLTDEAGQKVDASSLHPDLHVTKAAGATMAQVSLRYYLTGLDFGQNPLTNVGGTVSRAGSVDVSGYLTTSSFTVDASDLCLGYENGQYVVSVASPVIVDPNVDPMHLTLNEVTGHFQPTIGDITTSFDLDLGNDMDFLKQDDVELDFRSPTLTLYINNTSTVDVMANLALSGSNGRTVRFDAIDCSPSIIRLTNADAATGYSLNTFFSPVPDRISATISPYVDAARQYTVRLGEEFSVMGDYDVSVPLTFNAVSFTYDKRIDNLWGDSRDDVAQKLPSVQNALLKVTVENTLPMDLTLEVSGTNYSTGLEDASVVKSQVDRQIAKGSLTSPVTTDVTVTLSIPDTGKLGDLILRLKGQGQDCDLNARQYVRLVESTITLPEGVNVDLN